MLTGSVQVDQIMRNNMNHCTYSVDDVAVVIADVSDCVHTSFTVSVGSASPVPSVQYHTTMQT